VREMKQIAQAVLQPSVDIYNVANKANFDPPGGFITSPLRGVLDGSVGSANGTPSSLRANRYGLGSGVFSQGVPRAFEVGLRLTSLLRDVGDGLVDQEQERANRSLKVLFGCVLLFAVRETLRRIGEHHRHRHMRHHLRGVVQWP
jgi:hypothetical protein